MAVSKEITKRLELVALVGCEMRDCVSYNVEDRMCMHKRDTVNFFTGITSCPKDKTSIDRNKFNG